MTVWILSLETGHSISATMAGCSRLASYEGIYAPRRLVGAVTSQSNKRSWGNFLHWHSCNALQQMSHRAARFGCKTENHNTKRQSLRHRTEFSQCPGQASVTPSNCWKGNMSFDKLRSRSHHYPCLTTKPVGNNMCCAFQCSRLYKQQISILARYKNIAKISFWEKLSTIYVVHISCSCIK